jgi:hypothetical protein
VIQNLSNATRYWFAVEAYDDAPTPNYGGVSNSPTGVTLDAFPPASIANLAVGNPKVTNMTLTWTAPGNNGTIGTATGYLVKYSTSGQVTQSNWASATTYTQSWTPLAAGQTETHIITGLTNATRYWFAVEAYDDASPHNYGGVSNSPTGVTLDAFPPAKITDLAASGPTVNSITLTWTAPGNNGTLGNAAGYIVKYSTSGQVTQSNWASATTYTQSWTPLAAGQTETHMITGLSSGTTYWFAVVAYDSAWPHNYGGVSNSPSATTTTSSDTTPPSAISDLATSSPTGSSITLTWMAPGDNGTTGTATGYIVKYSTSGEITTGNWASATTYSQSWVPLAAGNLESHVVTGLVSDTTYWFAVEAYDEVPNYGGVSNSPSATTSSDTTPPSAIGDLATSNPTGSSITLMWTAPGDDGMTGNATGYIVKYSTSGSITASNWGSATTYTQSWTPAKNGTTETHTVTGLDPGTEYWFAVDSYDEAPNYSGVSNSPSATTTATTTTTGGGGGLPILVIAGAVAVAAVVILVAVIKTRGKGKRDR